MEDGKILKINFGVKTSDTSNNGWSNLKYYPKKSQTSNIKN